MRTSECDVFVNWQILETDNNDKSAVYEAIEKLIRGECAGVRVKHFLLNESIASISRAIKNFGIEYYVGSNKAGVDVKKGKLGPNFFRYKNDPAEYFSLANKYTEIFDQIILKKDNPAKRLMADVQSALGRQTIIATEGENVFSYCTVRDLSDAPPHTDWIASEVAGMTMPSTLRDQFAWNVHLQEADTGGETVVYQTEEVAPAQELQRKASIKYRPFAGDLFLFRARNVHAVMPSTGQRITLSGFFGPNSHNQVLFWV